LDGTTCHFRAIVCEELKGRECGVEGEHAETVRGEDTNLLDARGTTSTVLGQGDKCLGAHTGEEDGVESEGGKCTALLGLSGRAKSALDGEEAAVGDIGKIVDVGSTTDGTARVKDFDRCRGKAEHSLWTNDNKVCVMTIGSKGDCEGRWAGDSRA
jgi:hypothetical protein